MAQQSHVGRGRGAGIHLGILDEANETATKGRQMPFEFHDANLHIAQRVFFTVTPSLMDWRHGSSMDCPPLYGDVWYELSILAAAHDFLCIVRLGDLKNKELKYYNFLLNFLTKRLNKIFF